jgi:gamma-glutamyltranspeptidase/glutathione hydrolase
MVEAKRLAFADREQYTGDPDFVQSPIAGLISKEYARERARLIDPDRASDSISPGLPESVENTTCFVVVDRWGNAVSQLQSLQMAWGSGVVAGKTGILLNNRLTYCHLDPDHPDVLQPGKRPRHTMNPVIVLKDGRLFLVCGTPGADTQVQTNLQVLTHIIDYGLTPQEAVEAPRWRHIGRGTESTYPHGLTDQLNLEARFPEPVRAALGAMGHNVQVLGEWEATGHEQIIQIDQESGAMIAGSDARRDGYALAW